ncbi:hypothetical protein CJ010_16135 [Azoarcus sp. DD4]|uniref:hypothetical protein n=1 Tax=Azoarcus sp. DD4 TaxID=2027405 RepID=UPI00112D28E5|nr:hypothetical protein [Azoarcus sp. DD4]QDF97951.1 hypothetical protein CJ010_16135 [Azoarcus sp. DD4]
MTILKLILGFALAVALLLVFSVAAYRPPAQTVHRPAAQMDYAVRHDAEAGDAAGTARSSYSMAFVELDDDGLLAEPAQVERLLADLGQKLAQADTTILLYVHGWNHNAALDDDNVLCFGELARAAALMQAGYRSRNGAPRAVYAIYVGWPGVVYRREAFNKAFTFFGRQAAADRIGERGDLLHLFSRIARLRDQHQSGGAGAKFVIVSHSLGARLTYKALRPVMQSSVSDGEDRRYALLADVAVLVNPALSADEHAVLAKLVGRAPVAGEARRAPRFVIATSERDEVLGGSIPGRSASPASCAAISPSATRRAWCRWACSTISSPTCWCSTRRAPIATRPAAAAPVRRCATTSWRSSAARAACSGRPSSTTSTPCVTMPTTASCCTPAACTGNRGGRSPT